MGNVISFSDSPAEPSPGRLGEILGHNRFSVEEITELLSVTGRETSERLYSEALKTTRKHTGNSVRLRGIIEFSNRCAKNCYYCGIRRDNRSVDRYSLSAEEIIEGAEWIEENGYGSIVLQSGENESPEFTSFVESVLKEIKRRTSLGITLSVGEQSHETYRRWFDAGAHRYLLRIEMSNPEKYRLYHPADHSYEKRLSCLDSLRDIGYQVGTGVLIGLPGQTVRDLAEDIAFFRRGDFDMFGMGPYIIDTRTPLATPGVIESWKQNRDRLIRLSINMIAVLRLVMRDVNIAATTALEVLHPQARLQALMAGANVIMPVVTPMQYRGAYLLYEGKPGIDQDAMESRDTLVALITSAGRDIAWNTWGDSMHFKRRSGLKDPVDKTETVAARTEPKQGTSHA